MIHFFGCSLLKLHVLIEQGSWLDLMKNLSSKKWLNIWWCFSFLGVANTTCIHSVRFKSGDNKPVEDFVCQGNYHNIFHVNLGIHFVKGACRLSSINNSNIIYFFIFLGGGLSYYYLFDTCSNQTLIKCNIRPMKHVYIFAWPGLKPL